MKKTDFGISKGIIIGFLVAIVSILCCGVNTKAVTKPKQLKVLFTHDIHSHLESFPIMEDGEKVISGGFSRIRTLIKQQLEKAPDTLIIDAGDFSMGTLVQTVFDTEAAEIRLLGEIGCDVTTLGNHEFDFNSKGLANMLTVARDSGDKLPAMVLCNVDWDSMRKQGLSQNQQLLLEAFEKYGIKDYVVLQKGDVKIAVFGVFGKQSLEYAPTCELLFRDPVEASKEMVAKIKSEEDVDMIVCASHSGTNSDPKKSEDEILAKAVPDIDLIISGHSHTVLEKPIVYGNTTIVSCGEYGSRLGSLDMQQLDNGRWTVCDYELIPVTEDIAEDEETEQKIQKFMECVDEKYLSKYGYNRKQILAENKINFANLHDLLFIHEEQNMGNIISDAYIYAINNIDDCDKDDIDLAIVPAGIIRDTYSIGKITVEDVYNSFSLGIGEDGIPGYPLISVYLTGEELRTAAEVDASISDFMPTARLYCSGLYFTFNPNRMILNKVTDYYVTDRDGNRIEVDKNKLYHVVVDLYSARMLGSVTKLTHGLISIVPKNSEGVAVDRFEDQIIYDNGSELKAWVALASYIDSFKDTNGDGIGDVPETYGIMQGRKVVEDNKNIWNIIKNPNRYTMIIGVAVLLLAGIVFVLIKLIAKKVLKNKKS